MSKLHAELAARDVTIRMLERDKAMLLDLLGETMACLSQSNEPIWYTRRLRLLKKIEAVIKKGGGL